MLSANNKPTAVCSNPSIHAPAPTAAGSQAQSAMQPVIGASQPADAQQSIRPDANALLPNANLIHANTRCPAATGNPNTGSSGSATPRHLPTPSLAHHQPPSLSITTTLLSRAFPDPIPRLAFNVTHLTNPPMGFSWGPSAYLRSMLPEDMWRVAVDVLVETRLLAQCNFAVASDTLMANVPGLTSIPVDPHMPRARGSGARLVSLEFAVAVLVGFADHRESELQPPSSLCPQRNRLDLGRLLAMRVASAIDAVRALSAKYDHAQYTRAVQHNALVSWLSRAAGHASGPQPSPSNASQGVTGLEDLIEENDEEDPNADNCDDPIQVDSKLSSSTCSSHCPTSATSLPQLSTTFPTSPSDAVISSLPSGQRFPDNSDTDDPMDCDEGGSLSLTAAIAPTSLSASASHPTSTSTAPTDAPAPPFLFVVFADTGRICRATGTADVIQAVVQFIDILPWVTQMRAEFGRHFVLLHVVPFDEAVAAAESSSPNVELSGVDGIENGVNQQPRTSHTQQHHLRQSSSHTLPHSHQLSHSHAQRPVHHMQSQSSQHPRQQLHQHQRQPYQHQQQQSMQQQSASIEALLSAARLLG